MALVHLTPAVRAAACWWQSCDTLFTADGFRASGGQHAVEHRHANGGLGLLGGEPTRSEVSYSLTPRPGLPGRRGPYPRRMRIHESEPGPRAHRHDGAAAQGLDERLLRVAGKRAIGAALSGWV